jgi:hypothetical protein
MCATMGHNIDTGGIEMIALKNGMTLLECCQAVSDGLMEHGFYSSTGGDRYWIYPDGSYCLAVSTQDI